MRSLSSVESATSFLLDSEFRLKASDQSTTFTFDRNDIKGLSGLSWEIPFGGGLGRPSNYNITLASSMGFVQDNLKKIVNGESYLKVYVNSDNFTPHVGRVRDITRKPDDPNHLELKIYDSFLDGNPVIPRESIVDSYPGTHPEVINKDFGHPLYYGKHARPFYMTPVDCNIDTLLGPRNVSSENHVTSLWWDSGESKVNTSFLTGFHWEQQSGATNTSNSSAFPFGVYDDGSIYAQISPFEFYIKSSNDWVTQPRLDTQINGYIKAKNGKWSDVNANIVYIKFNSNLSNVLMFKRLDYSFNITGVNSPYHQESLRVRWNPTSEHQIVLGSFTPGATINSYYLDTSSDNYFDKSNEFYLYGGSIVESGQLGTMIMSLSMGVQMQSKAYKNYSIFGAQVSCSDIAISENPFGILKDLIDQTSFNYVDTKIDSAAFETSSYNLQCFMGERRNLSDIIDEFGDICGGYMWIGDSGYINSRTYQESASATIDATITTSDILPGTMVIRNNPLGTTAFNVRKAKRLNVNYDFNFTGNQYNTTISADPSNNSFCDSVAAAGVNLEINKSTKYILESDTASYWLGNLVRKHTQDETYFEVGLPARFFGLELADVVKIQHPAIITSETLVQITGIWPNYLNGEVKIKGVEILNL